jgi:hypothetical protein
MNSNDDQTPVTPGPTNNENSSFLSRPLSHSTNFRDLDNDKLQVLISLAINTLRDRGVSTPSAVSFMPKPPDIYDNARFEQIACAGLQPKYNGSPNELIPTLNTIHIQRKK